MEEEEERTRRGGRGGRVARATANEALRGGRTAERRDEDEEGGRERNGEAWGWGVDRVREKRSRRDRRAWRAGEM